MTVEPYLRDYGGGCERWALSREQMTAALWNMLCDGHGGEFAFAEFDSRAGALVALEDAGRRLVPVEVPFHVR